MPKSTFGNILFSVRQAGPVFLDGPGPMFLVGAVGVGFVAYQAWAGPVPDPYRVLIYAAYLVVLVVNLHWAVVRWGRQTSNLDRWLRETASAGKVLVTKKRDLYKTFLELLQAAKPEDLKLTYLHEEPPSAEQDSEGDYHRHIEMLVRDPSCSVSRVISVNTRFDTKEKKEWVRKQIELSQKYGPKSYSVRLYHKPDNEADKSLPPSLLNVAIFGDRSVIVDLSRNHADPDDRRDIIFYSADASRVCRSYFTRVFQHACSEPDQVPKGYRG